MRKLITTALVLGTIAGSLALPETASAAQGRHGAFAAGVATGVIGGAIVGGALARPSPYYGYATTCWFERRRVPDYDGYGWHTERVRVCERPGY